MKNVAHSVRQRLLNRAKETGQPNDLVLVRYALERLLYRLSVSAHAERFVLKGALLFTVWGQDDHRPTRDADLLGFGSSDLAHLVAVFREVCAVPFEDGIVYDAASVEAEQIAEDKAYVGARVTFEAELANARIPVQIDVGFGDAVTPEPETVEYPTLLDFPRPKLRAYPVHTVIAEKFHAMVVLGEDNSRMKDFYDLWAISRRFGVEPSVLATAIAATFARRKTELPKGTPIALGARFAGSAVKQRQWEAFVLRNRLSAKDVTLALTQEAIAALVMPAVELARK